MTKKIFRSFMLSAAAVMADVGVCLLAVGNSMRIFRVKLDM